MMGTVCPDPTTILIALTPLMTLNSAFNTHHDAVHPVLNNLLLPHMRFSVSGVQTSGSLCKWCPNQLRAAPSQCGTEGLWAAGLACWASIIMHVSSSCIFHHHAYFSEHSQRLEQRVQHCGWDRSKLTELSGDSSVCVRSALGRMSTSSIATMGVRACVGITSRVWSPVSGCRV